MFVDIGANVGIHTLTAALCLGPSGRVVALAPPHALARLCFNVQATRVGPGPVDSGDASESTVRGRRGSGPEQAWRPDGQNASPTLR